MSRNYIVLATLILSLSVIGCAKNSPYRDDEFEDGERYAIPTGLSGESNEDGQVELTWNPVTDATSYQISFGQSSLSRDTSTSETSITIDGLGEGVEYKFAVAASGSMALTSDRSSSITILVMGVEAGGLTVVPESETQDTFENQVQVKMSGASKIMYRKRINAVPSVPDCVEGGTMYTAPFLVGGPNETVRIKAVICVDGELSGPVLARSYSFGPMDGISVNPANQTQNPFDGGLEVTMSGAPDIRYRKKINGTVTTPSCEFSTQYTGPFMVGGPNEIVRIKAVACSNNVPISVVLDRVYNFGPVDGIVVEPGDTIQSPFDGGLEIAMSGSPQIMYRKRIGSVPPDPDCVNGGTMYTGPFMVGGPDETVRIKAVACSGGTLASAVVDRVFTFGPVAAPTIEPMSATQNPFGGGVWVSMSSPYEIHWKKKYNGWPTAPTCEFSSEYVGPFLIGGPNEIVRVRAIACEDGVAVSPPSSYATYSFGN